MQIEETESKKERGEYPLRAVLNLQIQATIECSQLSNVQIKTRLGTSVSGLYVRPIGDIRQWKVEHDVYQCLK